MKVTSSVKIAGLTVAAIIALWQFGTPSKVGATEFNEDTPTCERQCEGANLTIIKDAQPDGEELYFTFNSDQLGTFELDDDGDADDTKNFTGLSAGTYQINEEQMWGWDLKTLVCEGTENYTVDLTQGSLSVTLVSGDDVTCTFTNVQRNALGGFKYNDLNGNGKRDDGETTIEGWEMTLTKLCNNEDCTSTVTKIKTNIDGFYTFTGLLPGDYTVCEEQRAGWEQTYPKTSDGCYHITFVGPGQISSCYSFGNKQKTTPQVLGESTAKGGEVKGEATLANTGASLTQAVLVGATIVLGLGALQLLTRRQTAEA